MIAVKEIRKAFITDINANLKATLGLQTVTPHYPKYDKQTLASLMPLSPFVLVRYAGLKPIESERRADGSSGANRQLFSVVVGASGVLDQKDNMSDCEAILDALRDRYDGFALTVSTFGQVEFAIESEDFLESDGGLMAYYAVYSFTNM